jgi:hypothetical protein
MLAERLPTIMPELEWLAALEVSAIHSVAGALPADRPLIVTAPFCAPQLPPHRQSAAGVDIGDLGRHSSCPPGVRRRAAFTARQGRARRGSRRSAPKSTCLVRANARQVATTTRIRNGAGRRDRCWDVVPARRGASTAYWVADSSPAGCLASSNRGREIARECCCRYIRVLLVGDD